MHTKSSWVILAGLSLGAICAEARTDDVPPAVDAKALFGQLDGNSDGTLSSDEVPEEKKSLFDRLVRLGDGNADGKLSADEFAVGLAGGEKKTAAPADAGDAQSKPAKARPGRPGKAARPVPGRFLAQLDKNGDGKLSPDEVPEERRENFSKLVARLDKDGDGALSKDEMPAAGKAQPAGSKVQPASLKGKADGAKVADAMFKRMDANGDGKATADEAPEERREQVARMIRRADKDGDGAISREEFETVARQRAEAAKMRTEKPDANPNKKPTEAAAAKKKKPGQVQAMPASLFRAVDKDHDGKLNGEEITGASEAIKSLDKNGDGAVTAREIARSGEPVKGKKAPGAKKKNKQKKKPKQPQE